MSTQEQASFNDLSLSNEIVQALSAVGYERPSKIQSLTIPVALEGKDLIAQAQTGTGKTAAFALPILNDLDLEDNSPQALVLTPTRELAIQVSEAFQKYAAGLEGFHVLPIYGGQEYSVQLKKLKKGVQVVVGTPGRVMDHIRKGRLKLNNLKHLVLDEADEMLRMGFVDDVEWILEKTPSQRQILLFSATIPADVKRIAIKHLNEPELIKVKSKTSTSETVRQRYWVVRDLHKLDALTRILEAEELDGVIIFVRTKSATLELTDKLKARGFSTSALNGDIAQKHREHTVNLFKKGHVDILVATDVAARGLDIDRVSHVINYDIPFDTEAYIHRIGRTGRAGREGDAILFVSPRESRMLRSIEKASNKKIEQMKLPSKKDVERKRSDEFKKRLAETIEINDLGYFSKLVEEFQESTDTPVEVVAAALAKLAHGDKPIFSNEVEKAELIEDEGRGKRGGRRRPPRRARSGGFRSPRDGNRSRSRRGRDERDSSGSERKGKPKSKSFKPKGRPKKKKAAGRR